MLPCNRVRGTFGFLGESHFVRAVREEEGGILLFKLLFVGVVVKPPLEPLDTWVKA